MRERENVTCLFDDKTINFHQIVHLSALFFSYFLPIISSLVLVSRERKRFCLFCFLFYTLNTLLIEHYHRWFFYTCYRYTMLMKLITNAFERARSKIAMARSNDPIHSGLFNTLIH